MTAEEAKRGRTSKAIAQNIAVGDTLVYTYTAHGLSETGLVYQQHLRASWFVLRTTPSVECRRGYSAKMPNRRLHAHLV